MAATCGAQVPQSVISGGAGQASWFTVRSRACGVALPHVRGRVGGEPLLPGRRPLRRRRRARQHPRRLPRRPVRDVLAGRRPVHRQREHRGRDPGDRLRPRRPTDQDRPLHRHVRREQRVHRVRQPAQQPLDGGARQVRGRGGAEGEAVQRAGRVGLVRRALALQVRHEHQAARACGRVERELGQARRGRRRAASCPRRAPAPRSACTPAAGTRRSPRRNPAMMPVGSAVAVGLTAETTPDVPSDTTTSPGPAPSPSAAPALSPVPGPSSTPSGVRPAASPGPSTRGSTTSVRPKARSSRSRR